MTIPTPLVATSFFYSVHGQVRHGDLPFSQEAYVKTCYHHGSDWTLCQVSISGVLLAEILFVELEMSLKFRQGVEEGISQIAALKSSGDRELVWNFPIKSSWKSTNPHGWPRLILSVYGSDGLGNNDVAYGYGSALLPISAGSFSTRVAIYRPQSQSILHRWTSWFTGRKPELIDPKTVAISEGRDGKVDYSLNKLFNKSYLRDSSFSSPSHRDPWLRYG